MSVRAVLGEALDLYQRFFGRFVATAAIVFIVLDLLSAIADRATGTSVTANLLWSLIALVFSFVGAFWLQGALIEAVRDVRDGRVDLTIPELDERTRPRLPALIATGIVAGLAIAIGLVFGSLLVAYLLYAIGQGVLRALFAPLPNFASIWVGGVVAHSITTPFIAAVGAVMYFRLVRLSVGVDLAPAVAR